MRACLLTLLALSAAACTAGPSSYLQEQDRLAAQCAARGGVLTPSPMPPTGNPAVDNACVVPGGRVTR